jgi:hypothetical protein
MLAEFDRVDRLPCDTDAFGQNLLRLFVVRSSLQRPVAKMLQPRESPLNCQFVIMFFASLFPLLF